jgi:hypothetical protein
MPVSLRQMRISHHANFNDAHLYRHDRLRSYRTRPAQTYRIIGAFAIFPLIDLFHVLWLVRAVWTASRGPVLIEWLQVGWMVAYTVFWLAMCDLRKWGALGYMLLTALNLALFFFLRSIHNKDLYTARCFCWMYCFACLCCCTSKGLRIIRSLRNSLR